ncbi:MAG: pyridoxal 5'-phosphate synthase glutaminase subunit PdxT, partial [Chloroflexi bacterium]|nr:pyridoxal 5'-phosphate synthase glutaminase subunit PdxT [Chloroflexota bacterium]
MIVGVVAVQGDFAEHIAVLKELGVEIREVRLPKDLEGIDALIIPGGESTTLRRLFDLYH